jgi:hypothetical protein
MDAELRAKWIAALRGGEFEQTQGRLCNDARSAFCCLGVLAVVSDPNADLHENEGEFDPYKPLDEIIGDTKLRLRLVSLNDKQRKSFPEIADWIEKTIPAALIADHRTE